MCDVKNTWVYFLNDNSIYSVQVKNKNKKGQLSNCMDVRETYLVKK